MRNKYRLVTVNGTGKTVQVGDFPKRWGAERVFRLAPLARGHTIRLYRRRRFQRDMVLLNERGRGPRLGGT